MGRSISALSYDTLKIITYLQTWSQYREKILQPNLLHNKEDKTKQKIQTTSKSQPPKMIESNTQTPTNLNPLQKTAKKPSLLRRDLHSPPFTNVISQKYTQIPQEPAHNLHPTSFQVSKTPSSHMEKSKKHKTDRNNQGSEGKRSSARNIKSVMIVKWRRRKNASISIRHTSTPLSNKRGDLKGNLNAKSDQPCQRT